MLNYYLSVKIVFLLHTKYFCALIILNCLFFEDLKKNANSDTFYTLKTSILADNIPLLYILAVHISHIPIEKRMDTILP